MRHNISYSNDIFPNAYAYIVNSFGRLAITEYFYLSYE